MLTKKKFGVEFEKEKWIFFFLLFVCLNFFGTLVTREISG